MKKTIVVIFGLMLLASSSQSQTASGRDLEAYIEEIRASGISEMGRSHLYSVASVCAGGSALEYRVDDVSGRYWPSYTSLTCPNPNADTAEAERWRKLQIDKRDILVHKLKRFADSDGSGFITTKEAADFRWLVEYGYLVAQVIRDEGPNLDFVVRASGKDAEDAVRQIEAYKMLVQKIKEAGVVELPDVTVADAGAPFDNPPNEEGRR